MKASIFMLITALMAFNASAAIIPASENPAEPAIPLVFLAGDVPPHQNPILYPGAASVSTVDINDDVRGTVSLDLQALDFLTDEGAFPYDNGFLDLTFLWYFGGVEQGFNYSYISWDEILEKQLLGLSLLTFVSDDYLFVNNLLQVGEWSLYAYAEQQYLGGSLFNVTETAPVPEPASILLFVLSVAGVFGRRLLLTKN
ncbi:PEP-CTERM sorting domain-containing protein [Agarivorans aestuarii]|uniref:PEP-CTERM sorting domain-containing protein n=1 Tax=Agarivorans aestuarii TaxID=1563703 RepID=UPI001C80DF96|nr:PEP-CTERM sorting domain-containing protein [Agarivorans aestuarii]